LAKYGGKESKDERRKKKRWGCVKRKGTSGKKKSRIKFTTGH
jgi:hypothetical protein